MSRAHKWLKLLVLLCLCHIEVHVKAEAHAPNTEKYVSLPAGCWDHGGKCAIKASEAVILKQADVTLELPLGGVLQRNFAEALNLLEGELLVSTVEESVKFDFANGMLEVAPQSKLKLERISTGIRVDVLQGYASMNPRGKKEVLNFPAGYKAQFSWVDATGNVQVNLPESLTMTEWVSLFHKFYRDLSPGKLKTQLSQDFKTWRQAVDTATQIQQDYALREIAEAKAKQAKIDRAKAQRESEDKALRALFREKIYN